ncbi:Cob(I)yrinic acid a,c-diamide adenosyltransferase, mitochondrial [Toxocara canis]|uniref:Corrinoid adenosyltransferase MMAB n=1 Tax=Toxocara canis TaxID=6265 RepID=A0A0B2V9Y0_TOXCA|nr:Cob(I)yrinic acid a,c-diamide adenosyltransferase, mitochondrial [Toxocara canis]
MYRHGTKLLACSVIRIAQRQLHITPCLAGFKKGRGTGDQGKSSLFSNERRWKDDFAFQSLGTVDELSSQIGVCREMLFNEGLFDVCEVLMRIQCCLQDVGAHVATPPDSLKSKIEKTKFDESLFNYVDKQIDVYGDRIPPIRQFILPGGGAVGAALQLARTICRRAERSLVPLLREDDIDKNALRFLNRLSDLLFVLGRYACVMTSGIEAYYQRPQHFDPDIKWRTQKL